MRLRSLTGNLGELKTDARDGVSHNASYCLAWKAALAGTLNVPLMSDDRKERRIAKDLFPNIELVSSLDILQDASRRLHWDEQLASRPGTEAGRQLLAAEEQ